MRCALICNGRVINVIESSRLPTIRGLWVDVTNFHVGPGDSYNGTNFFPLTTVVSISPRELLRRFTLAERESLEELAVTGTAVVKRKLASFKTYIQTGSTIELNDDYIVNTIQAMESANVIAPGRAQEILGNNL